MNPQLIEYYSQELQHVREMGAEFAKAFPKVAGRLGLESFDCADPYVERLLEGFSFLAARVQMKIDAEFPRFTQHLAELVYPHYLAPTPAMAVVQMQPDVTHPSLAQGVAIPRGTALHGRLDGDSSTRCEFRTGHAMTLWPLELVDARLFTYAGALDGVTAKLPKGVRSCLKLRLRASNNLKMRDIALDSLQLYLRGGEGLPERLYELLLASPLGVAVTVDNTGTVLPPTSLQARGFSDDEALLPVSGQSFPGYRLLQEYFAFSQRFLFLSIDGLKPFMSRCESDEIELVVLLSRTDQALEQRVDASHFALHCTPCVNLFSRRTDRIAVSGEPFEHHVVPDRTRPMDFEVYQIESVTGYRAGGGADIAFQPFYRARDLGLPDSDAAFYQVRREKRQPSARQDARGARTHYLGSETFIALVDTGGAPHVGELHQLGLSVLCTNRDLVLTMPLGGDTADFTIDIEAPVTGVRCVAGPSRPLPSFAEGPVAWRLLSHLSLNYASLLDTDATQGARAMRDLLGLYVPSGDIVSARQVEGLRSIGSEAVTRRLPSRGPLVFGRGLEISLLLDEAGFEGGGAFLFGAVLARFLAQYVSLNSFTETVVQSVTRGEIMRWAPRSGPWRTL
jgi:type VI secretion system protein ImpG